MLKQGTLFRESVTATPQIANASRATKRKERKKEDDEIACLADIRATTILTCYSVEVQRLETLKPFFLDTKANSNWATHFLINKS